MSDMCPLGHLIPVDVFRCSICGMPRLPTSATDTELPAPAAAAPSAAAAPDPFAAAPPAPDPFAAAPPVPDPFAAGPPEPDPFAAAPPAPDGFPPAPAAPAPVAPTAFDPTPIPTQMATTPEAPAFPAPAPAAEWPPAPTPLAPYGAQPSGSSLNQLALLLIIAAAALAIGSLTPWVTVFGIGLSGVSIHYGIVSLVTAAAVGILVYLRSAQPGTQAARIGAIVVAVGGALSVASAIYVGWAIRSSFGDPDSGNDIADAFAKALRPGIGIGLWLVLASGIATLVLALPLALDRKMSRGPW